MCSICYNCESEAIIGRYILKYIRNSTKSYRKFKLKIKYLTYKDEVLFKKLYDEIVNDKVLMKTLSTEYQKSKEIRLTDNSKINIYLYIYNLSSLFFKKHEYKDNPTWYYGVFDYSLLSKLEGEAKRYN